MDDHVISGQSAARNNGGFTAKDLNLYRYPCEVLQTRGLPLQAQYTVANMARVFDCDIRVISDPIHRKKAARDLPFFEKRLATALFTPSKQPVRTCSVTANCPMLAAGQMTAALHHESTRSTYGYTLHFSRCPAGPRPPP